MEMIEATQNPPSQSRLYQVLGYASLLPFIYGTFVIWCGPFQDQIKTAEWFSIYSILILNFIAGTWWGFAFTQNTLAQRRMILSSSAYALFTLGCWLLGNQPLTILLLGLGFVVIWLHGFFVPTYNSESAYRVMRTLLTLTAFVCHLLVAAQLQM